MGAEAVVTEEGKVALVGAPKPTPEMIDKLESYMLALPQVQIPVKHTFAKGLYVREVTIPAGTLLTGRVHRQEHVNFVLQGAVTVLTESGVELVQAPATLVSKPGTRRVGIAHTEVIWATVHATEETDIPTLERELVEEQRTVPYRPEALQ